MDPNKPDDTRERQEGESLIDMSEMSKGKRAALEVAEAARQQSWTHPSFGKELFLGRFELDLLSPFPEQPADEKKAGDEYIRELDRYLSEHLDPDEVDRSREIPDEVMRGLFERGLFALKIPEDYGGRGFSQVNYNRIMMLLASYCGSTAVLASAHQSIGVPQPLMMYGTDEQKRKYLPRFARDAVSAFALTEPGVGSDPANMVTEAVPSPDGSHYVLNGIKQWCTNAPIADIFVVMAKTPPRIVRGEEKQQISAFIVERDMPGVELVQRCEFMGLGGMQNGNFKFTDVKVPAENMLGGEGRGLKLALSTLNIGRLTLPAACVGMAKQCLSVVRRYGNKRVQWGAPVGHHEEGRKKNAFIASTTFAMEAVTMLVSHYVDRKDVDIRFEAAMAKYFCSEYAWQIVDATMQLCSGRGYEKADSLKARGDDPYPVERMMRDARINMIIEGTSEIMRLFMAREASDSHLRLAADLLRKGVEPGRKAKVLLDLLGFYALWYPRQWVPTGLLRRDAGFGRLARHLRFVDLNARRLARSLFHLMVRYRAGLDRRQILLGHLMDVGVELFVMASSCSYAQQRARELGSATPVELADLYCREASLRIRGHFRSLRNNNGRLINRVGKQVSGGDMKWLEEGIVRVGPEE